MLKRYLLAPGPTPVPPEVLLAMARPMFHHRAPEFDKVFAEVREGLKWLFQTKNNVLMLAASGTGGMEGSVSNFLSPGDKALTINGGKFGERWTKLCKTFGAEVTEIKVEWGRAVDPRAVADALKKDPGIKAVYVQASETSTGVAHDIKALAEIVKPYGETILVVDAITALGVFDIKTDEWGIDVVITGSQKALMLPPGLAFVSVSDTRSSVLQAEGEPVCLSDDDETNARVSVVWLERCPGLFQGRIWPTMSFTISTMRSIRSRLDQAGAYYHLKVPARVSAQIRLRLATRSSLADSTAISSRNGGGKRRTPSTRSCKASSTTPTPAASSGRRSPA